MIVVRGETYDFQLVPRKENSAYEYENHPSITFRGRPANSIEKKNYRIQQGVNGNTDSVYVICSNLPNEIKPGDRITFVGKVWTVNSVGYYYEDNRVVNNSIMSNEYLMERCPKGLNLQ